MQREIYLKEEVEVRLKLSEVQPLSSEKVAELRTWEKELERID